MKLIPRLLAALLLAGAPALAALVAQPIGLGQKAAAIDSCARDLLDAYVFPDKAQAVVDLWRKNLAEGRYDKCPDAASFFQALQDDGQGLNHDLHFRLREGQAPLPAGTAPAPEGGDARSRRGHHGWRTVEVLPGNVGYIDLRGFSGDPRAGEVAAGALQFLSGVDALIIDLRHNGGGSPAMIQLLSSYLLPPGTWLNSFYIRRGERWQQFWTLPWVPGPTLREEPLYLLLSAGTFSAAEEFSYNLRALGRATLVGERTGGGAHPVQTYRYELGQGLWAEMDLPFGRAVNPITQGNWEGVGVEPHLAVPAAEALDHALLDFFGKAREKAEPGWKQVLDWEAAAVRARLEPVELTRREMETLAGGYGPRRIRLEEGRLVYQREGRPALALTPLDRDLFATEQGAFRLRVERDGRGGVKGISGLYDDGHEDFSPRD